MWWQKAVRLAQKTKAVPFAAQAELGDGFNATQAPDPTDNEPLESPNQQPLSIENEALAPTTPIPNEEEDVALDLTPEFSNMPETATSEPVQPPIISPEEQSEEEVLDGDTNQDGVVDDGDGDGTPDPPSEFDNYADGPQHLHEGCHCYIHRLMGGGRRWEAGDNACEQCQRMMRAFNADQEKRVQNKE